MEKLKYLIKKKQYSDIVAHLATIENASLIDDFTATLKKEEIFVDRSGRRLFEQYISELRATCPLAIEYCDELEIVNLLFVQERDMQQVLQSAPKNRRLSNILYCLNREYLHTLKKFKSLKPQRDGIQDSGITLDVMAILFNSTFKSLLYDKEICNGESFFYNSFNYTNDFSKLNECNKYIEFSALTNVWNVLYKDWKQGFVKIFKQGDKVFARYLKTTRLDWFKLSKAKQQIYDYIKQVDVGNVAMISPQCISGELNKFDELIAWGVIKDYLHINDLDTLVDDIPVRYWIKTYVALIRYSRKANFINKIDNLYLVRYFLSKQFFVKNKKDWLSFLINNGVPDQYAGKIFECLTYNRSSSDLYDFPFVNVKNKYMIVTSLLHVAHPGILLKSRFRQNDFNVSDKGRSFERELFALLAQRNIPVIQISRKQDKEEYECDLVFLLEDTLFLCECKDNGDKCIYNNTTDFYRKDFQQAKRIFDFFEKHLDEIKIEFANRNVKIGKIKRVDKLLIYNTVFHSIIEEKGIKIVDSERFISFFRRSDLDKRVCQLYKGPCECLFDKVTRAKFIKYLKSNFVVCGYDKIIRIDNERFEFGTLSLDVEIERCNDIDHEEIVGIADPFVANYKAILKYHGKERIAHES